jgi:hypothetical protein
MGTATTRCSSAPSSSGYAAPTTPAGSGGPPATATPSPTRPCRRSCPARSSTACANLHKSMMIELGTERVLQFERLGHELGGIDGVYSHVTDPMRKRLINQLQRRWTKLTSRAGTRPTS